MYLALSKHDELHVENRKCFLPHVYLTADAPVADYSIGILSRSLKEKTRVLGLPRGVVYMMLCLAVLVEHRFVTDRRTQGWPQDHSICRASIALRGKNGSEMK